MKKKMYHSNFNHNGYRRAKGAKSRAHNLRAENTLKSLYHSSVELEQICSPDRINKNLLIIGGKVIRNPTTEDGDRYFKEITASLDAERMDYLKRLENSHSDTNAAELRGSRSNAMAAFKRYAKGSKNEGEQAYWQGLTERLGNEPLNFEEEAQKLQEATNGGKITRYNDKIKRLQEVDQYNDLLGVKSKNTEMTVFSKEALYKIPDDSNVNVKSEDWVRFVHSMNKKLYPDFRCTYIAVHCDENEENPHAHVEFSGLNLKTGEMDIQRQLFINLEKQYQLKNKPFPLAGKANDTLTKEELTQYGEAYQTFIYEEINDFLLERGYKAKLEKRTAEEVKEDFDKFKDKHKPTQDRQFTRAKKLQEEGDQVEGELENLKELKKNEAKSVFEIRQNKKELSTDVQNLTVRKIELSGEVDNLMADVKRESIKLQNIETAYKSAFKTLRGYIKAIGKNTVEKLKELYAGYRNDVDYIGGYKPDIADMIDKATIENIDKALDHSKVIGLIERKQLENDREATKNAITERHRNRNLFKPR